MKLDVALGIARDSYDGKWGLNLFTFRDGEFFENRIF